MTAGLLRMRAIPDSAVRVHDPGASITRPTAARSASGPDVGPASNDGTIRHSIWQRYEGDAWAAFDQLPKAIRQRLNEHAYDAWSVNALILWRHYRRLHPTHERALRGLLRYLDHCERLERRAFAADYMRRHGTQLPHDAAGTAVLRYARPEQDEARCS